MEAFNEEEIMEPVSPTGQYLTSSSLSIYILAVMETELPIIDDSQTLPLLHNLFLPINPRFSSIMIRDKNGDKKWKKVEVKLGDHIKVPTFESENNSSNLLYDEYLDEYMSKIAVEHLPQHRPLWELHIVKYPTSKGMGTLVFKLHHALGDGFSLMGALLSCMERADKASLPFTLPSSQTPKTRISNTKVPFMRLPSIFLRTLSDFGWSLLKSNLIEDDQTPIRSAAEDTKTRHINISDVSFSFDLIKEVKSKLGVSINDVLAGVIFFGIRLYMEEMSVKSREGHSTALVLLNTRNIEGYKSIKEMVEKRNSNSAWGNQYAFLHAAAKYLHSTLRNSSTTISNMIGPVEQMAVANIPIKGFYFMVAGSPESLTMTIMSYMGKIRIAFGVEKDFIDKQLFKSSLENSLQIIIEAASQIKA
ncbi:hypothetical protein V8G54_012979 [Vigna mungo]|uniref:Diacylglycerol O-acyltransferase n=1 Tax=Vigna mungo TaxID=3915 RepID=A0AAQ3NVZ5_VIGMU